MSGYAGHSTKSSATFDTTLGLVAYEPQRGSQFLLRRTMPVLLLLHLLACCGVSAQTGGSPTQTLSRAGCACQPTLLSATSSSVTCYQANASAPFGCTVDPSDPCSDGVLGRTWDLCNIVDLYLVADQVASSTSSSSLNATLYGKQQVVLKKTQLSGVIFQRTVTKFTLALDNATQVESVKIEALVSTSLRIFEVQATLNDLPTTVFAPPSPGPISFVSSDDTAATGVVSLLFVPMTEYFDGPCHTATRRWKCSTTLTNFVSISAWLGDALGQCYFDLVGRCGYHADLQNSSDLLFLAEDVNEPVVAAKSATPQSFRRLSEQEKPRGPTLRSLSFVPKVNDRRSAGRSQPPRAYENDELRSETIVAGAAMQPAAIRVADILGEIRRERLGAGRLDLMSLETQWNTTSAIMNARIGGLAAKITVVNGRVVTRWRLVRQSSVVMIYRKASFASDNNFNVVVQVRVARKVTQYSKSFLVDVGSRVATEPTVEMQVIDEPVGRFPVKSSEDGVLGVERRLNTGSTGVVTLESLPLIVDLEEGASLQLLMSEFLSSGTSVSSATCKTTFAVFSLESVVDSVKTPSVGVLDVSGTHDPVIVHSCSETLMIWLKPDVKSIQTQLDVEIVNAQDVVLELASIPLIWNVIPSVKLPVASRLLVGARNTLAGNASTLELTLNYSDVPPSARVDITIDNCSFLSIQTTGSANATSEECTFLLKPLNESSNEVAPSGIRIRQVQDVASRVLIEVTTSKFEQGDDGITWMLSSSNILSDILHFCELSSLDTGAQILRKGETKKFRFTDFVQAVLGNDLPSTQATTNIIFVGGPDFFASVGNFQVGEEIIHLDTYNLTASFVTLSADNSNYFTLTAFQYGSFLVDLMLEWKDTTTSDSGCVFVRNKLVSILPTFSLPLFAPPYSFSRRVLQGGSTQITIPLMQVTTPEIESLTLGLAVNSTDNNIVVKRGDTQYYSSSIDPHYYFLVERDINLDSARQVVVSVTPNDSFVGTLRLDIGVAAVNLVSSVVAFAELDVELSIICQVEVEWIPRAKVDEPTTSSEAVYRSLSTELQGNSMLSFKYQMGSDFSSISTDVLLNSSEARSVWSSNSAVITQDQWTYVEALIELSYPSTVEIIFRGIASVEDTLQLKEIAVRDFALEGMVGSIEFVQATGGMIYIQVNTAQSIPDPVLIRAYARRLDTNVSPALSFTGKGSFTTILRWFPDFWLTFLRIFPDPVQKVVLGCRNPAAVYYRVNSAKFTNDIVSRRRFIYDRVLGLSRGVQHEFQQRAALTAIWYSGRKFEHYLEQFYHDIALFKPASSSSWNSSPKVDPYCNFADGLLSNNNCNVPSIAYLQLGRGAEIAINDTIGILPDTSVLLGAMDEIRIWKVARAPADILASFQKNIVDPDLILLLPFNSAENTNWFPSGVDISGNSIDFIVQGINVISTRTIHAFCVAGEGNCYYKLVADSTDQLSSSTCEKTCGDGSLNTCGSNTSATAASVYAEGSVGVGGLSPLTDYEISVEFVTADNSEYEITKSLIATTSNATVPGKVEKIFVIEQDNDLVEIQWSPVDDDGGLEVESYLVFLNGVQAVDTGTGKVLNPAPDVPQSPNILSVTGGTVTLALDPTTRLAIETLASVVVIQQRMLTVSTFSESFYRLNGSSVVLYKLRHNTVYIFRLSVVSKSGIQSAFSVPISTRTSDRGSPSKTPQPVVASVTDTAYLKWTSIAASNTSENTTTDLVRDAQGIPLLPETSYTFKVLALQVDVSCDTLTKDVLDSDAVTVMTEAAAVPAPPSCPTLLQLSGCLASVTAAPPDDFGGAVVTGMTFEMLLSSGVLHETFTVALDPGMITTQNLLAYTSYIVRASLNTTIGSSAFGAALTFTTEAPGSPGQLAQLNIADVGPSSVQILWQAPENTGGGAISGYLLYLRAINASITRELAYNGSADSTTTSFRAGGLLASTQYIFSVVPVNQYGISGVNDENVVVATTSAAEAPSAPTNLTQIQVGVHRKPRTFGVMFQRSVRLFNVLSRD
ncbi:hypothetical protein ON010_g9250 [Phytophthora cinnamomi]|nr:hypothetical protein ON010_g9250 [Phytophthora cinnamomi]